jgi:hypothetical protein
MSFIESGKKEGATLIIGGSRVGKVGYFIEVSASFFFLSFSSIYLHYQSKYTFMINSTYLLSDYNFINAIILFRYVNKFNSYSQLYLLMLRIT